MQGGMVRRQSTLKSHESINDQIFSLVYFVRPVLAAGIAGIDSLPNRMVDSAALSHHRNRSRRRVGIPLGYCHFTRPTPAWMASCLNEMSERMRDTPLRIPHPEEVNDHEKIFSRSLCRVARLECSTIVLPNGFIRRNYCSLA
jgi:hypothetical protein